MAKQGFVVPAGGGKRSNMGARPLRGSPPLAAAAQRQGLKQRRSRLLDVG